MEKREIFITAFDKERLEELIDVVRDFSDQSRQDLNKLLAELSRAKVVDPKDIPPNVVTMNSKVTLRDLDSSEDMTYRLAFPNDADIAEGAISILAPVGTAILGYKEGDIVTWTVPSGTRRLEIQSISYQPEAAGDYHL